MCQAGSLREAGAFLPFSPVVRTGPDGPSLMAERVAKEDLWPEDAMLMSCNAYIGAFPIAAGICFGSDDAMRSRRRG